MPATRPRVGLAEVLRRHGPAYLAAHPLSAAKAKVWRAILACRTAALGGHVDTCNACGTTRPVYNSCRNRHCPQCQTRAKEAWLAARQREVLPVAYFHLVFTLPHDLVQAFMQRIQRHEYLRCPHCGTGQFVPTVPIAPALVRWLHLRGPP